jgi:PIN domain nuclease of toxin-antitoxin system
VSALLLDTCAAIWWFQGEHIDLKAKRAIERAESVSQVLISPVSAWEISLLARMRGSRPAKLQFTPSAKGFVDRLFADPVVQVVPLTPEIAFDSCNLPGDFHQDLADRFLVATARALGVPIVTRDEDMQAYAKAGHVRLITC